MMEAEQITRGRRSSDVPPAQGDTAHKGLRIRGFNICAIALAVVLVVSSLSTMQQVLETNRELEDATTSYAACQNAARDLQEASDYLTTQARMYVLTGEVEYLDGYLKEIEVTDRRGQAVRTLEDHLTERQAISALQAALDQSNELAERELYAMRLTAEATGLDDMPEMIAQVELTQEDEALSPDAKTELASTLVLDSVYQRYKTAITRNVDDCTEDLIASLEAEHEQNDQALQKLLNRLQFFVVTLLATVLLIILAIVILIMRPLANYTRRIGQNLPLTLSGAKELRYLAGAYNVMYEENHQRTMLLKHAAEHDPLTGLCNRGAYDALLGEHTRDIALLLIDVDKFKEVNDTFGHDVGDDILKRVANALEHTFRSTDLPCRIGGDEFAVIMTDMNPKLRPVVAQKIGIVADAVRDPIGEMPGVTLSIGVAFSGAHPGEDDIYRAADAALYKVKERGRDGYAFYGEA